MDLQFTSHTVLDGVVEREFVVGDLPAALWSPPAGTERAPLVLMGHGGGPHKKTPAHGARWLGRSCARYKVVAIDAPGHGHCPRTPADERAREDMRAAVMPGDKARFESVSVGCAISLAERAVPEWQATLDAL